MANNAKKFQVKDLPERTIIRIATSYANTIKNMYSMADVGHIFNLTADQVSSVIDYAITHALISIQTCLAIQNRSSSNQKRHYNTASKPGKSPAYKKYDNLFQKRSKFIKENTDIGKATSICKNFIGSSLELKDFAWKLGYTSSEAFDVICKGAIFGLSKDGFNEFIACLKKRSKNTTRANSIIFEIQKIRDEYDTLVTKSDVLLSKINYYSELLTPKQVAEKAALESTLSSYEEWASNSEDDEENKKNLEERLSKLEGKAHATKKDRSALSKAIKELKAVNKQILDLEKSFVIQ